MSRIAQLLSYHLFGARSSLERLDQACKSWPSSSFSFPTKIRHPIVMKQTSSYSKLSSNNKVPIWKQQIV